MATVTKLLTADEYSALPSSQWSELIDGVVIEMSPPGGGHSQRQANVITLLRRAQVAGVGQALGELGCILRRNPDTVRAPHAAFIRKERVPASGLPESYWVGAPDLAAEIVSPNDRPGEIQTEIREWIDAGARQVWILYGESRTVHVARSLQDRVILSADELLEGGDAVPGFSCRVSELFD